MLFGIGLVILILLVVFFSGPRVEIDTTIHEVTLPADIEQYVADSEAKFSDITPGAEKKITWAGKAGEKTPLAVVYLHGFSATRQETAPLSELVAAGLGANLFCTRFTGHGRTGEAMLDGSVNAWLNDAVEAVEIGRRLGERLIVIGVSTGGTAATWLAAQSIAESVAAFVLLSPNFSPADPMAGMMLLPWGGRIAELIIGPERSWEPENQLHGKYWTNRYPTRALLPMMGMVKLVKSLNPAAITTPTLMIYAPNDQTVSTRAITRIAAKIGATRKQVIPYTNAGDPGQHVLAGNILSPRSTKELAQLIIGFIGR